MPGIVTKRFRIHNAQQFHEAFSEAAPTNMYVYIARPIAWPNEASPPTPVDSTQNTTYEAWRDIIALKRVPPGDVTFTISRYNWISGTVYTQYTNTSDTLFSNQFYVLSSDFNVYKCLYNNNGAQSTVQPSGTSTSIIETSDGYRWKYLYTITASEALKFVTTNFIPVKTLLSDDGSAQWAVQQAAANGSIDVVQITANGTGYLTANGSFSSITNSSVIVLTTGGGVSATDDIYNGSTIFISSGLGSGQVREVINYVGSTRTLTVNNSFSITPNTASRFHIGPKITFTGDGSGALAYANVQSNQVRKVTMISSGSNYSKASVSITANSSHGSGAAATAFIPPRGGHGSDPLGELGGHNVILNVKLTGSESNTFPVTNDFRIVGIIRDPLLANGSIANSTVYDQTTTLTLNTATGTFDDDEFVYTPTGSGRIVAFSNTNLVGSNGNLKVVNINGTFNVGQTITGNTSSETAQVIGVQSGALKPFFGDVLFVQNRGVVSRAPDQIEDIKLVVKF